MARRGKAGKFMAFGTIEFTTISRANDYSAIKQNEDNKGMVDQGNITAHVQKTTEQKSREVNSSDNAVWQEKQPDAREKGSNEYAGDGGRRRRETKPKERMVVKGQGGFDMKI